MKEYRFRVANLDCENDAARLRRSLASQSDVELLQILASSGTVRIRAEEQKVSQDDLEGQLREFGFPVQKRGETAEPPPFWKDPKVLSSLISGVLLLVGWLLGYALPDWLPLTLYTLSVLVGGYYFGREAIEEVLFERRIDIELLMTVAAIAAYVLGQPAEAAMLVFLYSISEALEGYTESKTRSAVRALMDLAPKTALLLIDGKEREIPVEDLRVGDMFLVRPGQAVATDGEVAAGRSSLNQAPVTGESLPVEKQPGETVFAGSINGEGSLEVRATKAFAENTISRIIQMVEEAQERKGESQRFIERFGFWYSPAVLLIGFLLAVIPALWFSTSGTDWTIRATVFVVAAAPCALVISIPVTLVASLGTGARNGVLIKGGIYVEQLARIRVVALDKTGTITRGQPEVTEVILAEQDESIPPRQEILAVAAGIERLSQHPLARAIQSYVEAEGVDPAEIAAFNSLTGAGASATFNGTTLHIGKPSLFEDQLGISLDPLWEQIVRLQAEGQTVVVFGDDRIPWGLFAIRDNIRPKARQAIDDLRRTGVEKVVMLTGDNERTAQAIAKEAGIDDCYADLKPEDKVAKVRELARSLGHVVMVGDGVNDAPALAEATVGVAMGAAGTDVALETADVALMADDLEKLVYALHLARRNQRVVRQNLVLSGLVISVLVVGAVAGWFSLPIAVLGHELSEFLVIGNGLRMLRD
ncbi:MAG: heavy metal translocating P-type ATPase [Gimesia sp.]|uniref:heavy metal translocating P-type ATPase n=1 Tax=Gimesia sp. TaxID=2024833 RepID=UPI000C523BB9|nr:cation-translocating P-type ATPase [Gimesia sp.]MAX37093.1 heavy metal translocating P-type ATPase [Gimesia sp.]